MPMQEFFADQLRQLQDFMGDPDQTVRCLLVDADLKPVAVKMLAGFDRASENPHVLIPSTAAFKNWKQYFRDLLKELLESYQASANTLRDAGVIEPFGAKDLSRDPPEQRVVLYLSSLSEGLPDHVGSLVVLLDPAEVSDPKEFRRALAWLAENTWSVWVKYLVLDDRLKPHTAGLEESANRTSRQVMYATPEEFEKQVRRKVKVGGHNLEPKKLRGYIGMLAGFAIARGDYAAAIDTFRQQLDLIRKDGADSEETTAQYCLGNALLANRDYPAAEEAYVRSLELAIANQQHQLMGLVLTQLGVALQRQGRTEEATESFRVARESARNTNTPPLEAFALDNQAKCFLEAGDSREAERCWKEALTVYDGITSDAFPDVREAGQKDIMIKLEQLYKNTRQPHRLAELLTARGGV